MGKQGEIEERLIGDERGEATCSTANLVSAQPCWLCTLQHSLLVALNASFASAGNIVHHRRGHRQ